MTVPILETPRLVLRPIRAEDATQAQDLFPHWELVKYMAPQIPWPYPADGAKQFFEEVALPDNESGAAFTWAITLKGSLSDTLIGQISLYPKRETDHRGFWLGLDYQRQGLMSEAMTAVNDYAFEKLGMPFLILNNAEPNTGSHRLKEISGAVIKEIIPNTDYIAGQKFSQIRWLLTREAWQANRHRLVKPAPV